MINIFHCTVYFKHSFCPDEGKKGNLGNTGTSLFVFKIKVS